MSSMRIVLVDPLGDVLFSGDSWRASAAPSPFASAASDPAEPDGDEDEADCPQTLRSGQSGIFPVERAKPATNANDTDQAKPDERAA